MATKAKDLIFIIKRMGIMDIRELGNSDQQQDTYLLEYLNRALKELAHIAYVAKETDVLDIIADGYQTFTLNGQPIDMYAPLRLLNANGSPVQKRTAFEAPVGWWRESSQNQIHTRGITGNHVLHYIAYPKTLTNVNDDVEFPDAGMMGLVFWTLGIIKESTNAYDESRAMYDRAKERLRVAIAANDFGRGKSTGGWVPSLNDVGLIY